MGAFVRSGGKGASFSALLPWALSWSKGLEGTSPTPVLSRGPALDSFVDGASQPTSSSPALSPLSSWGGAVRAKCKTYCHASGP